VKNFLHVFQTQPIQWVPEAPSPGESGQNVKLTTHLELVPRSGKCESIHPLPHYPFGDNFTFLPTRKHDAASEMFRTKYIPILPYLSSRRVTSVILIVLFSSFRSFCVLSRNRDFSRGCYIFNLFFYIIWFVRLLALRPLLAYCASLG
jgi:hypothetical protein